MNDLPRIHRFKGTSDCPDSNCPHCGAKGRWIISFTTVDGRNLAAMRGCVKLFPVSAIALEDLRLKDKAAKYAKVGWTLNRVDSIAVDMIEKYYAGEVPESVALAACRSAKATNSARFRRR